MCRVSRWAACGEPAAHSRRSGSPVRCASTRPAADVLGRGWGEPETRLLRRGTPSTPAAAGPKTAAAHPAAPGSVPRCGPAAEAATPPEPRTRAANVTKLTDAHGERTRANRRRGRHCGRNGQILRPWHGNTDVIRIHLVEQDIQLFVLNKLLITICENPAIQRMIL